MRLTPFLLLAISLLLAASCTGAASTQILPVSETPAYPKVTRVVQGQNQPLLPKHTQESFVGQTPVPPSFQELPLPEPTETETLSTATPFQICSPLELYSLEELRLITSDPYHPPPPGRDERHHGVDFSYYRYGERTTIQGVGVQSVLTGRVAAAIQDSWPFGNLLIIETPGVELPQGVREKIGLGDGQSLYILYAHMDNPPLVNQGEAIMACSLIGAVGKSGNAVEPHLHIETRLGPPGVTFESMGYYRADNTPEERENYLRWRISGDFAHFDPMILLNQGIQRKP